MSDRMQRKRLAHGLITFLVASLLLLAGPALAGPPAAIPESGPERAERAFESFTKKWMSKIRGEATRRGTQSSSAGITYRSYGDDVKTELKATGHAAAPYVGIIRYKEHVYSCSDAGGKNCSLASVTPVTEIFRFQNGRWIY